MTDADGRPGEWYLHLFTPEQPDLDWTNPDVHAEFEDVLRFWFDRGVDGFRIDVAHGLAKADGLPDAGPAVWPPDGPGAPRHPAWDRDEVHAIYREWRAVADSYDEPKVFVAEAWVHDPERLARYLRADELHTAFNFDFLRRPVAGGHAARDDHGLAALARRRGRRRPPGSSSNHDTLREVSRYARPPGRAPAAQPARRDRPAGRPRARAAGAPAPPRC